MVKKLLHFFKRPTSKDVIVNTLGNYLNVFFTALLVLLLVRILSRSDYGVFSVLIGISYVLANVLDFGTTATIYSYLPPMYADNRENMYRFIKSTFYYQSLFSFIVIAILFVTFPFLDKVFFHTGAPEWELYLTAISVLFFIWQNFVINCLNAAKQFLKANIYLNLSNLIKTAILVIMVFTHTITVGSVIFIYGILGPVLFFLFLFIQKKDLMLTILKADVRREEFRFKYTLTFFLSSQFQNLGLRMDLFLLSYFNLRLEVGDYAIAQKIILTIITTVISITQVLSPYFANLHSKKDTLPHIKTGLLYLTLPSALFVLLAILPDPIFHLFFTDKFPDTAALSRALSLPYILFTLGNLPMLYLLYTVKKPRYILWSSIALFLSITIGCLILIPLKGVFGPPFAILIGFTLSTLILVVASLIEYKKMPNEHVVSESNEKQPTLTV